MNRTCGWSLGQQMSAFTGELNNQPGELARLCEAMAGAGVNLLLCATTHADSGVVAFIADDEAFATTVLESADIEYGIRPALTIRTETGRASARRPSASSPAPVSTLSCSYRPVSLRNCFRGDLRRRPAGRPRRARRPGGQRVSVSYGRGLHQCRRGGLGRPGGE